ncbi:MAG: 50S ribosomal protein L3 N(5)-glutamine methyltransferase [Steroidobacteraceae bacterium]
MATLIQRCARALAREPLHYGHGTDNALDEAASLVWFTLQRDPPVREADYRKALTRVAGKRAISAAEALTRRRILERIPAPYLTQRIWFAGLPMFVDQRVLIPRSPIAELVEQRFTPWVKPQRVRRILDLGTGSGCIAIACARAFPKARVDASDISPAALEVARINTRAYRLGKRVKLVKSSYFSALGRARYDIIVSNPPYVGAREFDDLPAEYAHEPQGALRSGRDGLSAVRVILRDARRHLRPGGILVVEVGNSEMALRRALRDWPFVWLEFERGGGGVFLLTAEEFARSYARPHKLKG